MLTGDAQWKIIQKNTFTRWTNERLKTVTKHVTDLETDLSDGLQLIALVEVLSGKRFPKFNNSPNIRTMKLENVTMALKFLQVDEGIKIVNIDSSDIVDHNLKLILGLIWTLILHYSISMPLWEDDEGRPQKQEQTPKQRLFGWIQDKLPNRPVGNLTTDWNDGIAIGALVDGVAPGLCPDWESWNPENNVENATEAMDAAEQWLDIPQLIQPAEMCNPDVDELSMMTYLSQFPSAKLKSGAPLRPKTNPAQVMALGPEVEHLERKIRATKMNFQETNIRIEHSEHFQETTIITETELKEAKRENEILKEENKILKQEMEQKTKLKCCASEVEQLEKELRATKMNFQEINIRIEHLEHFRKTTIITETELKEAKRENAILKEENKILKQEMEHKTKLESFAPEVEQLEKELRATKMNFQETNIRIEHLEHFQKTTIITETELKEAKRENEILKEEIKILKQEMEHKTKLGCFASEVEQFEKELRATKMNFQETNIRIEHLEHFQKTTTITETELKEAKRENEILKEEIKILKQEMEHKTKLKCCASEVEQLKKELSETKMKLQETNRRTEHLNGLQKTMETELIVAKREIENLKEEKIMKQELEHKTKLECLASVSYEGTDEVGVRENEKGVPADPTKTFDDSSMLRTGNCLFIVGMKLHTRMWCGHKVIGAMEVFYNTGQSVVHGSKNPNTAVKDEEFRIGQNEYITEINVQMGHMFDGLTLTTNKGIVHGPFGGGGGGHKRFVCPREGAYLAYITGSVDAECDATAIRRLRFIWGVPKYFAAK